MVIIQAYLKKRGNIPYNKTKKGLFCMCSTCVTISEGEKKREKMKEYFFFSLYKI
jgi:hypothetical protein